MPQDPKIKSRAEMMINENHRKLEEIKNWRVYPLKIFAEHVNFARIKVNCQCESVGPLLINDKK